MLTNCLAECAHLTITVSQIERDIGRKSSFFHAPLAFDAPVSIIRRISAIPFGTEQLEWLGYQMVKKFENIFIRFGAAHERDRQTDRRTDRRTDRHNRVPAIAALLHSIARQKSFVSSQPKRWAQPRCNSLTQKGRGASLHQAQKLGGVRASSVSVSHG